ncbi:hypothetical protein CASFOL_031690 [Castilleja foliolosa]|uniref:Cytochrome b561 and DOMON domain-containing protein n=1 Tax=Castilleja foliolosa TaxID=1961234 RepID=A0ABD3C8D8_9LAMI
MPKHIFFIIFLLFSLHKPSNGQSCSNYNFATTQTFTSCTNLPFLNSFLHWNYNQSSKTVQLAYRHVGSTQSRWVAWAVNPTGHGMVGSQAIVAFKKPDGTMRAYTTPIDSYQTKMQPGDLSFRVSDLSATSTKNQEIVIFATLELDENIIRSSSVNHVWQEGPLSGDFPAMHGASGSNVKSMGTIDLISGNSGTGAINSNTKKKNVHGVMNAISWGIMMPVGAVFARYLKVFPSADPAWFYLHATCQTTAYITGVAGFATGLRLGSESVGVQYTSHRFIGIALFCLGTLQVFALLLRPNKDHKHRFYWNIYHHTIGYSVIILSIVNVFKGFDILNPDGKWKKMYILILIGLALVAATLEVYTWCVVSTRKRKSNDARSKSDIGITRSNGYNGYEEARIQDRVV